MSTLDQAFIRAYQAGTARSESSATKPASNGPAQRAESSRDAERSSLAERAPLASAGLADSPRRAPQAAASQTTLRRQHFVDAAHRRAAAPVVEPHYAAKSLATSATSAHAETADDEYARLAESLATANRRAARVVDLTASAPYAEAVVAGTAEEAEPTASVEPLRAAFETQRFMWPRNVEVLIASAGNEFAELAHEIRERSSTGRKVLVVTGAEREEGRTTLVLALARMASTRGLRTAVVDLDLLGPTVAENLGLRPELGWDDALADRLTAAEAMIESLDDGISVLPLVHAPANPRSLAGSTFLRQTIADLRERFDLVLLDVGPLSNDEQTIDLAAVLCGAKLDDAIVVRDRRRTVPKQVQAVCRRLAVLGIEHWDVAENYCELQDY